jgi:integrase
MASVEQRGDGWRVRWRTLGGEPRSRQCPDRRAARELKAEIEHAQALGRDWTAEAEGRVGPGLDDLFADALVDAGRRLKASTVQRTETVLALFLSAHPDATPAALTVETLHRWHGTLLARGLARRTAASYLFEVAHVWRWAYDSDRWGSIVPRPRKVDPGPVPPPAHVQAPALADIDRAIAAAAVGSTRPSWPRRLMLVVRFTGLRAGQASRLTWTDVDLDARRLVVRPELGKSRQEQRGRALPIHSALAAEMAGWGRREGLVVDLRGKPVDHALMARIYRDAGVETQQPFHGIRHAVATHMRRAGVSEDVVGRLLGHGATVTGAHYIDPAALWPAMVDAIATLPELGAAGVTDLDARRAR